MSRKKQLPPNKLNQKFDSRKEREIIFSTAFLFLFKDPQRQLSSGFSSLPDKKSFLFI